MKGDCSAPLAFQVCFTENADYYNKEDETKEQARRAGRPLPQNDSCFLFVPCPDQQCRFSPTAVFTRSCPILE